MTVQYPTLMRTNYNEWSLLMRVNLQAQELWHAVEPEEEDVIEYRDDRLTFAAILRAVPPEMLASLTTKRTAQSAWEAIKSLRIGVQRMRDANIEQLRKEFDSIRFKDGETVDDFSMRLAGLANNIAILGGKVTEGDIVRKMLHVVPEPLEQVAISIETLLDLDNLSVEEVTGHMCNVEQRISWPPPIGRAGSFSRRRSGGRDRATATTSPMPEDPPAGKAQSNSPRRRKILAKMGRR
jgi:hypothetical protein